jgi:enoyl-CoA hydratase/carnithine racemase
MADDVELSIHGEVAMVQLRRPFRGNALRGTMFDQLRKIALKLSDAPPKFVVLAGEGSDFCTGLDRDPADPLYQAFEPMVRGRDAFRTQELIARLRGTFDAIGRLPCPVIAAVEGRCLGAGFELALVADVRIASETAVFQFNDAAWGLVTGLGGLTRATLLLGGGRATDRVLTGRPIDHEEALTLGLVTRVAPGGSALSAALELVHELRRSAPGARTQGLLALRAIQSRGLGEMLEQESQAAARTWIQGEWQAALKAAKDLPEPSW